MELLINEQINKENEKVITNEQNKVEKNNEIDLLVKEEVTVENQNKFLQTTLGKTINAGLDIGLRAVLPDMIEEQIIDIKNVLLTSRIKRRNKHSNKNSNRFWKKCFRNSNGKI